MCGLFRNLALCKEFRKEVKDSLNQIENDGFVLNFPTLITADVSGNLLASIADVSDRRFRESVIDMAFDLVGLIHTLWLVWPTKNNPLIVYIQIVFSRDENIRQIIAKSDATLQLVANYCSEVYPDHVQREAVGCLAEIADVNPQRVADLHCDGVELAQRLALMLQSESDSIGNGSTKFMHTMWNFC